MLLHSTNQFINSNTSTFEYSCKLRSLQLFRWKRRNRGIFNKTKWMGTQMLLNIDISLLLIGIKPKSTRVWVIPKTHYLFLLCKLNVYNYWSNLCCWNVFLLVVDSMFKRVAKIRDVCMSLRIVCAFAEHLSSSSATRLDSLHDS